MGVQTVLFRSPRRGGGEPSPTRARTGAAAQRALRPPPRRSGRAWARRPARAPPPTASSSPPPACPYPSIYARSAPSVQHGRVETEPVVVTFLPDGALLYSRLEFHGRRDLHPP